MGSIVSTKNVSANLDCETMKNTKANAVGKLLEEAPSSDGDLQDDFVFACLMSPFRDSIERRKRTPSVIFSEKVTYCTYSLKDQKVDELEKSKDALACSKAESLPFNRGDETDESKNCNQLLLRQQEANSLHDEKKQIPVKDSVSQENSLNKKSMKTVEIIESADERSKEPSLALKSDALPNNVDISFSIKTSLKPLPKHVLHNFSFSKQV